MIAAPYYRAQAFDDFLFRKMRMAGTSPAMAMFGAACRTAMQDAVRYFGSTAMPGKKK
jgi:hypothetical protein